MALRRTLASRLLNLSREPAPSLILQHSPIESPPVSRTLVPGDWVKKNFHREFLTSPEPANAGFFRRFLQRRKINQSARFPDFLSVPVGDKLMEKLRSVSVSADRLHLEGLSPPVAETESRVFAGISVKEAKKILKSSQLAKVRSALREIPANSISYSDYVRTCVEVCSNRDEGLEFAKKLDESGNVIVLGEVVLLRPEQVARSVEKVISRAVATPNDPRRRELELMEKQKAIIDHKARKQVQAELYCGLGFLTLQTLGFMRLTFWELSWDVMEPICFFVTSFHFALAYGFFLRTSKEPTFEGFFKRRFRMRQKKLMEIHSFDLEKYNELCRAFYPNHNSFAEDGVFRDRGSLSNA